MKRNTEYFTSCDVARAVKSSDVRISTRRYRTVRSLRLSQSEFVQFFVSSCGLLHLLVSWNCCCLFEMWWTYHSESTSVRHDQRGKIQQIQQCTFQKLTYSKRSFHNHDRFSGKTNRTLQHGSDFHFGTIGIGEILEKTGLDVRRYDTTYMIDVFRCKFETLYILQRLLKSRKYRVPMD